MFIIYLNLLCASKPARGTKFSFGDYFKLLLDQKFTKIKTWDPVKLKAV